MKKDETCYYSEMCGHEHCQGEQCPDYKTMLLKSPTGNKYVKHIPKFTEKQIIEAILKELEVRKRTAYPFPGFASMDPDKVEDYILTVVGATLRKLRG